MRVAPVKTVQPSLEVYVANPWDQLGEARRAAKGADGKRLFPRQTDLADALGCAQQTVSSWETGTWPVPDEYVVPFCQLTGCPEDVVREINEAIRKKNSSTTRGLRLPREGVSARLTPALEWQDAVGADTELDATLRSVLLFLPRFAQIPGHSEVALNREELLKLADVTTENLMDVWVDVLSSGYVSALGRNVYVLTKKKP